MLNTKRTFVVAAVMLAAALSLPTNWAGADPQEGIDIDQKISSAKTAADHEAIAKYFADKADEAKNNATTHRKMGETYKKMGGSAVAKWDLPAHCERIAKLNENLAATYGTLADAHREMAKAAK